MFWCVVEIIGVTAAMKASMAAIITFVFIMICVSFEIRTWWKSKVRVQKAVKESPENIPEKERLAQERA